MEVGGCVGAHVTDIVVRYESCDSTVGRGRVGQPRQWKAKGHGKVDAAAAMPPAPQASCSEMKQAVPHARTCTRTQRPSCGRVYACCARGSIPTATSYPCLRCCLSCAGPALGGRAAILSLAGHGFLAGLELKLYSDVPHHEELVGCFSATLSS